MLEAPEQEMLDNHPSTTASGGAVETPYTSVKVLSERTPDEQMLRTTRLFDIPRRVQQTREASQEDALASAKHFFAPKNGQDQALLIRSHEETPITITGGATIETSTLTTTPQSLLLPLPQQQLMLEWEVLVLFFLMVLLLDLLQQLPVGHEHGYGEFQKDGWVCLPLMILNQERVIYMYLLN